MTDRYPPTHRAARRQWLRTHRPDELPAWEASQRSTSPDRPRGDSVSRSELVDLGIEDPVLAQRHADRDLQGVAADIEDWLRSQGVDVDAALNEARWDRTMSEHRQDEWEKDARRHLEGLASGLRKAKRKADLAYGTWVRSPTNDNFDYLNQQRALADRLDAQLREACGNDQDLISQLKRDAARRA